MELKAGIWVLPLRERPEGTVRILRGINEFYTKKVRETLELFHV